MLHQIIFGLLLGWGAAIPIGPMNLEIIRRNLQLGTPYGIALGLGACSADLTYIVLMSVGALAILSHAFVLKIIGILGGLILAWFGFSALRMQSQNLAEKTTSTENNRKTPLWRHTFEGYLLTLLNPFTVLFWSSVSAQIAVNASKHANSTLFAAIGVLLGTFSWICGLNTVLHFTRHKLSERHMHYLNIAGGCILLIFAALGLWRALF